jgi:outer membrane protein assembly factor BamB
MLPLVRYLVLFLLSISLGTSLANDWPMWRHDGHRSAVSSEQLPESLELHWSLDLGARQQAWEDPLNKDLLAYDRSFEPIVMEGRLFLGFSDSDKLVAFEASSGGKLWTFYTEGPVRLPPVGWQGHVYFCSDDGYLYCVRATDGELAWKFRGGPNARHALGNRRLVSAWPARGGPVIRDGTVYFAASIWPFMGTFIYALDASPLPLEPQSRVRWVNDQTGSQYIKQPHSASSFAGVGPQGALVATDEYLLVPGGRTVPAVFERRTGKFIHFEINAGGKGTGGSFVAADEKHFFVHTRLSGTREFDLKTGVKTAFQPGEPVLAGESLYSAEFLDEKNPVVRAYDDKRNVVWELPVDGRGDLILAGDELIAGAKGTITFIRLAKGEQAATVSKQIAVDGEVARLLVADGKLFVVTLAGQIMALGARESSEHLVRVDVQDSVLPIQPPQADTTQFALSLKGESLEGYGFWFGRADDLRVKSLAMAGHFMQLAVVDNDPRRVLALQRELDREKLLGRVTVHCAALDQFLAPPYVAQHVFVGPEVVDGRNESLVKLLYQSVRPYGGKLHLLRGKEDGLRTWVTNTKLEQGVIAEREHGIVVHREGPLPGAADWTHQYGDIANTLKSNDSRVKLPLGILWFGGNSNEDVLPRHGHGPPEQVVGGRLFIQGINSLSARDVYTGRVLWRREFQDLGTFDVYYDQSYENVPLDPKYNQLHIPGANGRGTNYVVTEDRIYILEGSVCHVLDPVTGNSLSKITLPPDPSGEAPQWGYIGVYKDVLLAGLGFANYGNRLGLVFEKDHELKPNKAGFGSKSLNRAASLGLAAFDRYSGQLLWRVRANHSFWHNGIVAGGDRVYCLDRNPSQVEEAMLRRGLSLPTTYRIVALNIKTGLVQWETKEDIFGSWLSYSEKHDLLLQAGAQLSDRLATEVGKGMTVFRGSDGTVKWSKLDLKYAGPCILHNDLIITNIASNSVSAGAYDLLTGIRIQIKNPLTGKEQPWSLVRTYGCNSMIASEHTLTFRSGAAGFCDLSSDSGTGNLGGFKSGCTSNLVVANGVLNAPDYTRTCSCAYQNQASLALVPMPDVEVWTVDTMATAASVDQSIRELAVNFGAPGDRRDESRRLWLEYPIQSGDAPGIQIATNPEAHVFRQHATTMTHTDLPWVCSSGLEGITELKIGMVLGGQIIQEKKAVASDEDDEDAKKQVTKPTVKVAATAAAPKPVVKPKEAEKVKVPAKPTRQLSPASYTVKLYFASPPQLKHPCQFSVLAQGKTVIENITLDPLGTPDQTYAVHTLENVTIATSLELKFVPKLGKPVINGIEVVRND